MTIRPTDVTLRQVLRSDLPLFFEHQRDPLANELAAFPPRDREAFDAHWDRLLGNETLMIRTILAGGEVAGNVVCFEREGQWEVGYWLGREHWGRGIATAALATFLAEIPQRPLHDRVARHNVGSVRVLEKCGFRVEGSHTAPEDGVEELLLVLPRSA